MTFHSSVHRAHWFLRNSLDLTYVQIMGSFKEVTFSGISCQCEVWQVSAILIHRLTSSLTLITDLLTMQCLRSEIFNVWALETIIPRNCRDITAIQILDPDPRSYYVRAEVHVQSDCLMKTGKAARLSATCSDYTTLA